MPNNVLIGTEEWNVICDSMELIVIEHSCIEAVITGVVSLAKEEINGKYSK